MSLPRTARLLSGLLLLSGCFGGEEGSSSSSAGSTLGGTFTTGTTSTGGRSTATSTAGSGGTTTAGSGSSGATSTGSGATTRGATGSGSTGGSTTTGGSSTGSSGPATAREGCDAYVRAVAGRYESCGVLAADAILSVGNSCAPLIEGAAAGRLSYSRASAGRCLAALPTMACETLLSPDSLGFRDCHDIFLADVPRGGACRLDLECAGPNWCELPEASCGLGHCVARAGAGQECVDAYESCVEGYRCNDQGDETHTLLCDPEPAPYDAGPRQPDGGSCTYGLPTCGYGLVCSRGTPRCVPVLSTGEACDPLDDRCVGGALCTDGRCHVPSDAGEPCWRVLRDGGAGGYGYCPRATECDFEEAFRPDSGGVGHCQPARGFGSACSTNSDCAFGNCDVDHCGAPCSPP